MVRDAMLAGWGAKPELIEDDDEKGCERELNP
jgi:hypothetical protein